MDKKDFWPLLDSLPAKGRDPFGHAERVQRVDKAQQRPQGSWCDSRFGLQRLVIEDGDTSRLAPGSGRRGDWERVAILVAFDS